MEFGRVIAIGDRVPQGSTFPVYGRIETPEGNRVEAILKLATYEKRVPPEAILNEWVATKCAEAVGLQTAPCWLIEMGDHERAYFESRFGLSVASSLGFATQRTMIDPLTIPDAFSNVQTVDPLLLFLFDMLFVNADRIPDNPNCGRAKGRLFAYDFGRPRTRGPMPCR